MCDCLSPSLLLYEMGTNVYPYPRVTDEAAEAPGGQVTMLTGSDLEEQRWPSLPDFSGPQAPPDQQLLSVP